MAQKPYGFQGNFVAIDASTSGDNTLVAAVPGMSIRVIAMYLISSNTNTLTFQSSTTTNLSGPMDLTSQEMITLPPSEYGWMQASEGELLNLNLSASNQVSGSLIYFLV